MYIYIYFVHEWYVYLYLHIECVYIYIHRERDVYLWYIYVFKGYWHSYVFFSNMFDVVLRDSTKSWAPAGSPKRHGWTSWVPNVWVFGLCLIYVDELPWTWDISVWKTRENHGKATIRVFFFFTMCFLNVSS